MDNDISMTIIYRPWITLRNGIRLYAKNCGKRVFRFEVEEIKSTQKQTLAESAQEK